MQRAAPGSWLDGFRALKGRNTLQYSVARFAGSVIHRNVIPGLRSLSSLTRGYPLLPLRGSLMRTSALTLCLVRVIRYDASNKAEKRGYGNYEYRTP